LKVVVLHIDFRCGERALSKEAELLREIGIVAIQCRCKEAGTGTCLLDMSTLRGISVCISPKVYRNPLEIDGKAHFA